MTDGTRNVRNTDRTTTPTTTGSPVVNAEVSSLLPLKPDVNACLLWPENGRCICW